MDGKALPAAGLTFATASHSTPVFFDGNVIYRDAAIRAATAAALSTSIQQGALANQAQLVAHDVELALLDLAFATAKHASPVLIDASTQSEPAAIDHA
eukprot:3849712-Karenia_brevis.AAC.1